MIDRRPGSRTRCFGNAKGKGRRWQSNSTTIGTNSCPSACRGNADEYLRLTRETLAIAAPERGHAATDTGRAKKAGR